MKKSIRRLLSSVLTLFIVASIVLGALAPLFSPPTSVAQTNPQTTDIFTGQFIPAYLGSAYDPTEAYKQLAGATVYVFGYDTWGRVVNDFAYRTQVKADGSFQAAGLPNASHYGVFFPNGGPATGDDPTITSNERVPFRTPTPEDQIETAFAYSQAVFPGANDEEEEESGNEPLSPRTQINNERIDGEDGRDEIKGQRIFLTSSRSVDIENHINIFPLIPTTVLSVVIQDNESITLRNDAAFVNAPYEIYAQRVVNDLSTVDEASETPTVSENSFITHGPVIRGRTILTSQEVETGAISGPATREEVTMFQAYAPPGIYAITYWRPDSKNADTKVTYLNYNGEKSLDTPVNGMAFERVGNDVDGYRSDWLAKLNAESGNLSDFAWHAYPGSTNLWGVITSGQNHTARPLYQAQVTIKDSPLYPVQFDLDTRECMVGQNQVTTNTHGIYFFTNACEETGGVSPSYRHTATIDVAGNGLVTQNNVSVSIGGEQGPTRRDVHLASGNSSQAYSTRIMRAGRPYLDVTASLYLNNRHVADLGRPNKDGYISISQSYMNDDPFANYQLNITPDFPKVAGVGTQVYRIDRSQMNFNLAGGIRLEDIILDRPISPLNSALAGLSLPSLLAKFRIPTVHAQASEAANVLQLSPSSDDPRHWLVPIDQNILEKVVSLNGFTSTNWSIDTLELVPDPDQPNGTYMGRFINARPCGQGTGTAQEGYGGFWKAGDTPNAPSGDSDSTIIGFRLVCLASQGEDDEGLDNIFDSTGLSSINFRLKVRLNNNFAKSDTGQEIQGIAGLATDDLGYPVTITRAGNGFTTSDVSIPLSPEVNECDFGDALSFSVTEGPRISFGTLVKEAACTAIMGVMSFINWVFSYIAEQFTTIDPVGGSSFSGLTLDFWNVVRNFVNAISVLILIAAGVAIMLRYEPNTFRLQTVLRQLIIVIVAVNFSILILQVAIDIANVLAYGGFHYIVGVLEEESSVTGSGLWAAVIGYIATALLAAAASGLGGWLAIVVGFLAIGILLAYVGFKIMIQYYFRVAVLLICIVSAPAAIAAMILPGTKKYFGKWKDMVIGALVAQVALGFTLAVSLALLNRFTSAESLMDALLMFILAFVLFYMATIIPNRAAAAVGVDLASGLQAGALKGLAMGRDRLGKASLMRERRRSEEEMRLARGESKSDVRKKKLASSFRKFTTGTSLEDLDKERESVFAESARDYRKEQERKLRGKGLIRAEAEDKIDDEKKNIELRMISAKGGISQGKFERNRDLTDTGHNVDYSVGGKVNIGGDEWKAQFRASPFYRALGGDEPGSVAQQYLDAIDSVGGNMNDENTFNRVLDTMNTNLGGGADLGSLKGALEKEGVTFSQLQGTRGMKGYMLTGALNAASKLNSTLDTDYGAMRNQLGRNQYNSTEFNAKANPGRGPVLGPPAPQPAPVNLPNFTPGSLNSLSAALGLGGAPTFTPPTTLPSGVDPQRVIENLNLVKSYADAIHTDPTVVNRFDGDQLRKIVDALEELRVAGYH